MRLHIRHLRHARGLTQEQLAERVEMNPATISQLERDRHGWTSHTLSLMATALEAHEHEVLGYTHGPDAELTPERMEAAHLLDELSNEGVAAAVAVLQELKKAGLVRNGASLASGV